MIISVSLYAVTLTAFVKFIPEMEKKTRRKITCAVDCKCFNNVGFFIFRKRILEAFEKLLILPHFKRIFTSLIELFGKKDIKRPRNIFAEKPNH